MTSLRLEISDLWGKLSALYGAAFTKPYGIEVDKTGVWHQSLALIDGEDIEYGFKKLVLMDAYSTFPPNPMQFREICKRTDKRSLPSLQDAYQEAKNFYDSDSHVWSHHAVKFCAVKTSSKLLNSPNTLSSWRQFKELYEKVTLAVNGGVTLPKISEKPVHQAGCCSRDREIGKKYLIQIKQILSKGVH